MEPSLWNVIEGLVIAGVAGLFGWMSKIQSRQSQLERTMYAEFVTKADLADIKKDMDKNFDKLEAKLDKLLELRG